MLAVYAVQESVVVEAKKAGKYNEQGIIKPSCNAIIFKNKEVRSCVREGPAFTFLE